MGLARAPSKINRDSVGGAANMSLYTTDFSSGLNWLLPNLFCHQPNSIGLANRRGKQINYTRGTWANHKANESRQSNFRNRIQCL
jgi:hypothetical protein